MAQWKSSLELDIPVGSPTGELQRPLTLDLYLPERGPAHPAGPGRPPLVVYVHGGGWREGSNDRPPGFRSILARGCAIAALQYRFSTEGSGLDMLADLRRGVQVARERAAAGGVNVDSWFLWGISAGGHLVSLLAHRLNDAAVTSLEPASTDPAPVPPPAAVVPWCGVFDLAHFQTLEGVRDELRDTVLELDRELTGNSPEERRALSPITYVGPESPPHLFVHGTEDRLVPPAQSVRMHEALTGVGARSQLMLVPDTDHAMPPGDSPEIHATLDFMMSCTSHHGANG